MNDCLFCKIINKEIPTALVFENNKVIAILNINPINPGHILVMPKKHSQSITDTDDEILSEMAVAVKRLAIPLMNAVGAGGYNLEVNNGAVAGQEIFHAHWHLIPRFNDDGLTHWKGKKYDDGEIESIAEKIRNNIK